MGRREHVGVALSLVGAAGVIGWGFLAAGVLYAGIDGISLLGTLNVLAVSYGLMEIGYAVAAGGDDHVPGLVYGDRGAIGIARGAPLLTATCGDDGTDDTLSRSVTGIWFHVLIVLLAVHTIYRLTSPRIPGEGGFVVEVARFAIWILLPLAVHYDTRYVKSSSDWDTNVYWWLGFFAFPVALGFAAAYLYSRHRVFDWRTSLPRGIAPMTKGRWHYIVVVALIYWMVILVAPEWNATVGNLSWLGLAFAWLGLPLATYLDLRYLREEVDCVPTASIWVGLALVPGLNLLSGILYLVRRYEIVWLAGQTSTSPENAPDHTTSGR